MWEGEEVGEKGRRIRPRLAANRTDGAQMRVSDEWDGRSVRGVGAGERKARKVNHDLAKAGGAEAVLACAGPWKRVRDRFPTHNAHGEISVRSIDGHKLVVADRN